MTATIEHYTKLTNYVIDVDFEDELYTVYIGTPQGETDRVKIAINAETTVMVPLDSELHTTLIAAAEAEISAHEDVDITELFADIQQLSDPLIVRDAEELLEALTAINEIVKNR
jgi:hypothetical protein